MLDRITADPEKMGGVPCIRGLRIPVSMIVGMVADGMSRDEILDDYPDLVAEDIEQALKYATHLADGSRTITYKEPKSLFEIMISCTPLLVSLLSVAIAFYSYDFTVSYYSDSGETTLLPPSGYAIIRGIRHFRSDHLVLPMEWKNTSGQSVLIRHPTLILREKDSQGGESDRELEFPLAGEYQNISDFEFEKNFVIKRSFILETHSISLRTFVFHIEKWWDENSDNYDFRFLPGT